MKTRNETKNKNYSRKLGKLGGEAYEHIVRYKISKKFFVEDLNSDEEIGKIEDNNFYYNKSFIIDEIKNEIIEKLTPSIYFRE